MPIFLLTSQSKVNDPSMEIFREIVWNEKKRSYNQKLDYFTIIHLNITYNLL